MFEACGVMERWEIKRTKETTTAVVWDPTALQPDCNMGPQYYLHIYMNHNLSYYSQVFINKLTLRKVMLIRHIFFIDWVEVNEKAE